MSSGSGGGRFASALLLAAAAGTFVLHAHIQLAGIDLADRDALRSVSEQSRLSFNQGELFPAAMSVEDTSTFLPSPLSERHQGSPPLRGSGNSVKRRWMDVKADPDRLGAVRDAMRHAWSGYWTNAKGHDEVDPDSLSPRNDLGGLGATIIDSLDTLHIMNLTAEFADAKAWVVEKFRPTESGGTFSVFETTIRHLGGLMAAYELSGDASLLDRARDLGDHLLLAFRTPTGIPMGFCQLKTGSCTTASWMPGRVFLADVGSLQLEMSALSFSTGNATYSDTAERAVMALLNSKQQPGGKAEGLLYRMYNPLDGAVMDDRVGMGAFSDSAYEYLLKLWVAGGRSPAVAPYWRRWEKMALAVDAVMVQTSSPGNLTYLADAFGPDFTPDRLLHELEHFACFAGGMFVLGAEGQHAERFLQLGRGIGETCYQMYARTATGLAPDRVYFRRGGEDDFTVGDPRNCLRPETVESLFYLYRKTGEQKYRDQGWAIFQAFEKHSKAKGGYSGLRDVRNVPAAHDGIQQSFFLAETLKYLYLLFADGNTVHLDEWVFNTEAHLMRVRARQSSLYTYP